MSVRVIEGDCSAVLASMGEDSVDCVVTSPPYWGLRDYGVCGQIGLETTLAEHLAVMVGVFEGVRRVLKPTGTLWLNYGDCYATSPNGRSAADTKAAGTDDRTFRDKPFSTIGGMLKAKDLCMVPNRLAIALQEAGWWVRSEIIWAKPNPMPESIKDRPSTSHEKIFLLTKGQWKSRVVKFSDLSCERFHFGQHIALQEPLLWKSETQFCVRLATAIFDGAQRQKNFSLPAFYAEEWKKRSDGSDSEFVRGLPVIHRPAVFSARLLCAEVSPEEFMSEIDGLAITLSNTNNLLVGGRNTEILLPPSIYRDGDGTITVDDAGQVGKIDFSHKQIVVSTTTTCKYFYDAEAVRQPSVTNGEYKTPDGWDTGPGAHGSVHREGRQKGETVAQKRTKQAQTAESAASAGGSSGRRMAGFNERWDAKEKIRASAVASPRHAGQINHTGIEDTLRGFGRNLRNYEPAPTEVWPIATQPFSEAHFATFPPELAERCILAGCPRGGTVLDPFGGAGTTGLVADRLQRHAILIELNPAYAAMARKRVAGDAGMFAEVA